MSTVLRRVLPRLARTLGIVTTAIMTVGLLTFGQAVPAEAKDPVATGLFSNVALEGYDSLAYHKTGKPTEGITTYETEWRGAVWRFATAEDRDLFAADPGKYAPAYGGYCANAMSYGKLVDADPEIWRIIGDRLYVYYADSGRQSWIGHEAEKIAAADANWRKFFPDLGD